MGSLNWSSAITEIGPNTIRLRGYPVEQLMGKVSYADAVYLALMGELPDQETSTIMNAILVSSIDHGTSPPSVLSTLTVASTGAPLGSAVAAGILSISKFHGGAIQDCMTAINQALDRAKSSGTSFEEAALEVFQEYKERKERLSGFGHRLHTKDPRTVRLLSLVAELGRAGDGITMAKAFEAVIAERTGKSLPLNVDGAIAAVLVDVNVPAELANAFFMIARLPGLVAHAHEEIQRQRPMRKIHPTDVTYDGPKLRHLT
ncbi:MAG: citryl-CoA lyase [candidate division Zixibacteria bacterium]|nr:citryl-CoA lyase [candidate division Zixibacteria bacterium]